jgi:MFS superfamily sulfate permease-like transporter
LAWSSWLETAGQERGMFAAKAPLQDPNSLTWIILLVVTATVFFWKTMIKVLAAAAIALAVLGALEVLRVFH